MRIKLVCSIAFLSALSVFTATAQEIATWANWKKAAVTFTFDDAANEYSSHKWAADQLAKYKYPATFYVVTGWTNGRWANYQAFVNQGHEVGSHTDTHSSNDGELVSSKNKIDQNITGQKCLTIAYPNCNVPTESLVLQNYIGGRICGGRINAKSPSNYAQLDCFICGSSSFVNSTDAFTNQIESASKSSGWVVFLIHGIEGYAEKDISYSPTSQTAFNGALSYLNKNENTYWVCTFRDAIMYAKERDNSNLVKISSDDKSVTYSLTKSGSIKNSSICGYDYPLSVRVPIQDGWSDVSVKQSGKELASEVKNGYVYFNAVPDAGDIVIGSSAPTMSDPLFSFSGLSQSQDWCTDSTYTISWSMIGDAVGTYSLNWNISSASSVVDVNSVSASSEWTNDGGTFSWSVDKILSDDGAHGESSRWGSVSGQNEYVIFNLSSKQTVAGVLIDEFTEYGNVSGFEIQYDADGTWKTAYTGTTIGNDFRATFSPVQTTKMRLFFKEAGSGVNINYVSFSGVSGTLLKSDIASSGSFAWKPEYAGKGMLSINKENGSPLATSASISVTKCGEGGKEGGETAKGAFFSEDGAYFGPTCDADGTTLSGAYYTGDYTSPFSTYLGKSDEDIQTKLDQLWNHYFVNENNKVYYDRGNGEAYIYDTGSEDVRSEGMSYGMMICVQTNHKEQFDKLWSFAKNHMWHKNGGNWDGYFAWQVSTDGGVMDQNCAPDGELYFTMSLLFAANRWGEKSYMDDAQYILKSMWKNSSASLFNEQYKVVTFQPVNCSDFSDPSYDLPGFVDLFSRWSNTNNNIWAQAATATREHLIKSSNSSSGLFSDYNNFDGTPKYMNGNNNSHRYMFDAMRCAMNVGMDYYWFGADAKNQEIIMKRLIDFFDNNGYKNARFNWDGSSPEESYTLGETGANAVACYALLNDPSYEAKVMDNLKRAWNASLATGKYRYYDGLVHYLSMLHLCGSFRIWKPAPEVMEKTVSGSAPFVYGGKTYTSSTQISEFKDCKLYNVNIELSEETSVPEYSNFETSIGIVPNPAKDRFMIICKSEIQFVKVFGLDGRLVMEDYSGQKSFSTESLDDGIYVVCVASKDGRRLERLRLSVHK